MKFKLVEIKLISFLYFVLRAVPEHHYYNQKLYYDQ